MKKSVNKKKLALLALGGVALSSFVGGASRSANVSLLDVPVNGLKGDKGETGATGATGTGLNNNLTNNGGANGDNLILTQTLDTNTPAFLFKSNAQNGNKIFMCSVNNTFGEMSVKYYNGTSFIDVMTISNSGTISKIGGGSFSAISDERVKDNIVAFEKGLAQILSIETKTFQYKKVEGTQTEFYPDFICNKTQYGVIAQQLQAVCPEMVTTDEQGFLSVDLSNIPLMLVNAVKELNAKDIDQQKQITALKSENAKLKTSLASIEERLTALETPTA